VDHAGHLCQGYAYQEAAVDLRVPVDARGQEPVGCVCIEDDGTSPLHIAWQRLRTQALVAGHTLEGHTAAVLARQARDLDTTVDQLNAFEGEDLELWVNGSQDRQHSAQPVGGGADLHMQTADAKQQHK
jgi:hypothetical protein